MSTTKLHGHPVYIGDEVPIPPEAPTRWVVRKIHADQRLGLTHCKYTRTEYESSYGEIYELVRPVTDDEIKAFAYPEGDET
jgi:hypothetical protein